MDPWGHIAPFLFKDVINKENGEHNLIPEWCHFTVFANIVSVDIRPTIAITKAHMKVFLLDSLVEQIVRKTAVLLTSYSFLSWRRAFAVVDCTYWLGLQLTYNTHLGILN